MNSVAEAPVEVAEASPKPTLVLPDSQLFPVISDRNLMDRETGEPVMLIDGIIEEGTLTMVSGTWGAGKTALLLSIAIAAKQGKPLAGQFAVSRASSVLFVGLDASPYQYAKQYRRLDAGLEAGAAGVDFLDSRAVDIANEANAARLKRTIERASYDLVVFDTLNALSSYAENDNTEMGKVMRWLGSLCTKRRTVVFTHHTGKPGIGDSKRDRYASRGASAIPASCDAEWRVEL